MTGGDDLAGNTPIRDLLLILSPLAIILYFLVYPDQLKALTVWMASFLQ
jgi:hypothetical protein